MHLEIQQSEKEGVAILDLKGHVVLGAEDSALRQTLQSLADGGRKNLIVNLEAVSDIDTAGFGSLVGYAEKLKRAGGRLALVYGKAAHANAASALKLDITLDTYADEESAVNSFFPDRATQHYDILEFVEEQELIPRREAASEKESQ